MFGYTVLIETAPEGGFVVSVPALLGCHTQAETRGDAVKNAREAITVYLEELRARGEQVPLEIKTETQFLELPEIEYGA